MVDGGNRPEAMGQENRPSNQQSRGRRTGSTSGRRTEASKRAESWKQTEAESAEAEAKLRQAHVPRLADALRQARRKIMKNGDCGAPVLPGCDRGEVEDFDAFLRAVEWCGERLVAAFALLKCAPGPLLECLKRQGMQQCLDQEPMFKRFLAEVTDCSSRLSEGEQHVKAMRKLAEDLRTSVEKARDAFPIRDAAWVAKNHYDAKVERLRAHPARTGPSFVIEAQVSRNRLKQVATNTKFQDATATIRKEAGNLLAARQTNTAALLVKLCQCHAVAFGSAGLETLGAELMARAVDWNMQVVNGTPLASEATQPLGSTTVGGHQPVPTVPLNGVRGDGQTISMPNKYREGDRLQVWNSSEEAWVDGIVEKVYTNANVTEGCDTPVGSIRVSYSAGMRLVMPDEVCDILRPPRAFHLDALVKGAPVEVWSNSQKAWQSGIIEQVFEHQGVDSSGFIVAAGTVKVTFGESMKFIPAEQVPILLRSRSGNSGLEAAADRGGLALTE